MPGEYEIEQIVDLAAADKNISGAIALIEKLEARLKEISAIQLDISGATKLNDVSSAVGRASTAMASFKKETREGAAELVRLQQAQAELNIKNQEATLALRQQTLEIRKAREEAREKAKADKEGAAAQKIAAAEQTKVLELAREQALAENKIYDERIADVKRLAKEKETADRQEKERVAAEEARRIAADKGRADALRRFAEQEKRDAEEARLRAEAASKAVPGTAPAGPASVGAEAKKVDELTSAYTDLLKVSVQLDIQSKKLADEKRDLDKAFKEGLIDSERYAAKLAEIKNGQLQVGQASQQARLGLKNLTQLFTSTEKSLINLRAQLNLSVQAFDRLSDVEKKAAVGLDLNKKIKSLTASIREQEEATGRFSRNVGNYSEALKGVGGFVKNIVASGIAMVGLYDIGRFLSGAVDEFNQAEQAASRFRNILDNVGRSDVMPRLVADADALADEFKQLDNDDIIGVFEQLTVYGKLTENQMKQLAPVIINFAQKTGLSLEDATRKIVLGLEGQGKAFKEYGINIKDAGSTTEAFGLIMTELAPKVEGAAKAFGETTQGEIAATRQEINNLKEDIGGKLQPVLGVFYKTISAALDGIGIYFTRLGAGLSQFYESARYAASVAKSIVTLDLTGAAVKVAVERTKQDAIRKTAADQATLNNIAEQANAIAKDASTKPLKEQQKILAQETAIYDANFKRLTDIVKAKRTGTAEEKAAQVELQKSLVITQKLRDVIERTNDKTIIGGGDHNKGFKEPSKAKDTPKVEDLSSEIISAGERERKARAEALKIQISEDAAMQERISQNERNELDMRLEALGAYLDDREALIAIDNEQEVLNITEKLARIAEIEATPDAKRTNADRKLLLQKQALLAERVVAEAKAIKLENDLERDGQARRLVIIQSGLDKEAAIRLKNFNDEKDRDDAALNNKLISLNTEFDLKRDAARISSARTQEKIEQEFADKKLEIQTNYQLESLLKTIDFTEQEIQLAKLRGEDTTAAEKGLAAVRINYSNLVTDAAISNGKKNKRNAAEVREDLEKTLASVNEIYGQVAGVISSALDAQATAQKNQLQDQIDMIEKRKAKEIEAINASSDAEQVKADKITLLTARAAAQREQLEAKQRQIDQRKAQYDKALAIGQIVTQTALAVVKALPNIPLAVLAGALGAAQLAVAIATPVPKYFAGKGEHDRYEGPAYVGDGGRAELIHREDGRMEVTPATKTLTYVNSRDIVYPDAKPFLAKAKVEKMPVVQNTVNVDTKGIISAINGQPRPVIKNTLNGWVYGYQQDRNYTEWKNRNMQS